MASMWFNTCHIFARNHLSTSASWGELEGWNPCIVGCDISSFQKMLLKSKETLEMLHGFAKVLDLLALFFMVLAQNWEPNWNALPS